MPALRPYLRTLTIALASALAAVAVSAQTPQATTAEHPQTRSSASRSAQSMVVPADTVQKKKGKASKESRSNDKKKNDTTAQSPAGGAQEPGLTPQKRFKVEGGVLKEIVPTAVEKILTDDSSKLHQTAVSPADTSLKPLKGELAETVAADSTKAGKHKRRDDTSTVRYSALFRDTIPLSRMTAISLIAPGFSQLYNKQAWKIPILYGVTGGLAYLGFQQSSKYKEIKKEYNSLVSQNAAQEQLDPVQCEMIRYNTRRTVFFVGAIASYLYFLCDGVLNYNGPENSVKKATTLSTLCPGAGQLYNRSYWKVPIVVGAFATMGYVIDWNARGYNRYRKAYNQVVNGEPDEFEGRYSADYLKNMKDNFRRNRDLCIILTGALYLLNIVDAHVDAHLKDYDISDDLSVRLEPTVFQNYTMTRSTYGVGMSLKVAF
jgi:hypothetical protein